MLSVPFSALLVTTAHEKPTSLIPDGSSPEQLNDENPRGKNRLTQNYPETTTILRSFVRDYPGELVPEKNTHPPTILIIIQSLSASSIYHDP